jgi:ABC-type transport system involved in cytochrome bd biosynthesis fused ATPase/permease subunit
MDSAMTPLASADHYRILTSMLAPALLMAATGSLLVSANNRLARVVDRLRQVIVIWKSDPSESRAELDAQIARHRQRARLVLRACLLLYLALAAFVGTSLGLAIDALFYSIRLWGLPTALAVIGVLCLLAASAFLGREVSLSVRSFDEEIDLELSRPHRP